jgi:glutathionyl-hydroquinone reductase
MEKMTIHRALSELKLVDAKIEKQISEVMPTGIYQKGKLVNNYIPEADFEKNAKSKFDSVSDLIERKNKIKSAIVDANGKTQITVGGKQMSIADAINFKTVIKFKKKFAETLKQRHKTILGEFNKVNETIQGNAQKLLEAALGKDNVKAGKDDVEAIRKPYIEANEFHLFDPLKVEETVEKLEKEVSEFEAEVDAVLSEANAVTFIEI